MGALLGPSFGFGQDVLTASGAISSGQITQSDVKAGVRMLPFQNLFYVRGIFGDVGDALNAKLNLPKSRK